MSYYNQQGSYPTQQPPAGYPAQAQQSPYNMQNAYIHPAAYGAYYPQGQPAYPQHVPNAYPPQYYQGYAQAAQQPPPQPSYNQPAYPQQAQAPNPWAAPPIQGTLYPSNNLAVGPTFQANIHWPNSTRPQLVTVRWKSQAWNWYQKYGAQIQQYLGGEEATTWHAKHIIEYQRKTGLTADSAAIGATVHTGGTDPNAPDHITAYFYKNGTPIKNPVRGRGFGFHIDL